jgi:hypothetical protein
MEKELEVGVVRSVCSFSQSESTPIGRLINPCTAGVHPRNNPVPITFFGCTTCLPSKRLWRCSSCWKGALKQAMQLAKGSKSRQPVEEVMGHPDMAKFLAVDFDGLDSVPAPTWCRPLPFVSLDTHLEHDGCPCCYNFELPLAPPLSPDLESSFNMKTLDIGGIRRIIQTMPVCRYHGRFEVMSLVIEVVDVHPVLSKEEEREFKFRTITYNDARNDNVCFLAILLVHFIFVSFDPRMKIKSYQR